jgi:hydroxypyruvate reductase
LYPFQEVSLAMIAFAPALYQRDGVDGARRRKVVEIMQAALAAVDPYQAVRAALCRNGDLLRVGGQEIDLAACDHVWVVGAGKAGAPMARAVEEVLADRLSAGCVTVKYGHTQPTHCVTIQEAGHPIPDQAGVDGSRRIAALLAQAGPADLVICLISGGGSALMSLPVDGVSLDDMRRLTDLLLRAGATINEINTLRKHLEQLKGGQLARLAHPARIVSLILSDVVGNPLDVIASGPTVPDTSTLADAWQVVERYALAEALPDAIRAHLQAGLAGDLPDTPKRDDPALARALNVVVASNDLAAAAAQERAQQLGLNTLFLTSYCEGEAREVARVLAAIAKELRASGRPVAPPACVIVGGETTVTLKGQGKGGRNQELALAGALALQGVADVTLACLATDGSDGPTDASGALADGQTVARARAIGLDAWHHLENNDAYPFFAALDDLLLTGPTNTNVNDLTLLFAW